ncbi:hypothetical protein Ancab_010686 [Ancistrocladus abbreviatus]
MPTVLVLNLDALVALYLSIVDAYYCELVYRSDCSGKTEASCHTEGRKPGSIRNINVALALYSVSPCSLYQWLYGFGLSLGSASSLLLSF